MERQAILDAIAPCALCCYTCPAKKDGILAQTARTLYKYHEGYCAFLRSALPKRCKRICKAESVFLDRLEQKAQASCNGCRDGERGKYCIRNCFVSACAAEHGVDFCGECDEFPCDKGKELFARSERVLEDWLAGNERIRAVGAQRYYEEVISRSHYASFAQDADGQR